MLKNQQDLKKNRENIMGSYLPLKIGNILYPVKVGGFTGKNEPKVSLTVKQLTKLKRAVKNDDTAILRELEQVVDKTAVQDIRSAYMAWIPKEVVKAAGINTDIKKLTFVLPSKIVIVPVRTASKWLIKKTKGRTKPIAVWFGDPEGEKLQPFMKLMNAQLRAGLYEGLKLLDTFTLSRKPKKTDTVTYYRKAKNAATEDESRGSTAKAFRTYARKNKIDISSVRLMLTCTPHGNPYYRFFNADRESVKQIRDISVKNWPPVLVLSINEPNLESIDLDNPSTWSDDEGWYVVYAEQGKYPFDWDVQNKSLAPVKGSKRVTRSITPRDATVLGRSGEINLPNPERRTGRKKTRAKKRVSSKTRAITIRIPAHQGTSKRGKKTDVKAHSRQIGKAKKFKNLAKKTFRDLSHEISGGMIHDVQEMARTEAHQALTQEQALWIAQRVLKHAEERDDLYRIPTTRLISLVRMAKNKTEKFKNLAVTDRETLIDKISSRASVFQMQGYSLAQIRKFVAKEVDKGGTEKEIIDRVYHRFISEARSQGRFY